MTEPNVDEIVARLERELDLRGEATLLASQFRALIASWRARGEQAKHWEVLYCGGEEDHFPDASEGKVVWPLKDVAADEWLVGEEGVSHADALATLWEIADCDLELTGSKEDSGATGDIALAVAGVQTYTDAPSQFFYVPIRQALETALENYPEEEVAEAGALYGRSRRLLLALLRAYTEWEAEA